jgi:hypothetical protein
MDRKTSFFAAMLLLVCAGVGAARAQMPAVQPDVYLYAGENLVALKPVTTQTEVKPGWTIQGRSVGRKTVRYLARHRALQLVDSKPRFAIYPASGVTLADYVVVRLVPRSNYRRFPSSKLSDCPMIRVDLNRFSISNLPNMGFAVMPSAPLRSGEYCLLCTRAKAVNEQGDIPVYEFRVE